MIRSIRLGSVLLGILYLNSCSQEGSTDIPVLRVPVTVEEVGLGDISSFISLTGTITPIEEMDIVSDVSGVIHFEPVGGGRIKGGDPVGVDQVVAKIENEEYVLNIGLEGKALALEHAKRDLEDKKKLDILGGATQREVENAERTLLSAETAYKTALINLEKLNIKSPLSGTFTEVESFVEGQKINAGAIIGNVMRYDIVKCNVNITADDFANVWKGQEVIVTNISRNEEIYIGEVTNVSPTIDPVTRTFKLEIVIDNPEYHLKSGSFVKVDIVVEKRQNIIKIPKRVITTNSGRDVVFVVENQVARMKPVVIGLQDSDYAEIIQGLNVGDLLISRGHEALKNNTKVRISR
ncbi:efflux RND transporter periplasmic adaptor subunit [candidate division KSB1 bacterium]|nr:efflux RND transporter periplasmic adaptor subunit [candidate division KSB1 bacterium]